MVRFLSRRLGWFAFALGMSVAATGCKQGVGERCQVPADCESGLNCTATDPLLGGVCFKAGTGDAGVDASVSDLTATLDATSAD